MPTPSSMLLGATSRWTPARLPSLYVYDDNRRTAAWDSGVSTENLTALTTMCWVYLNSVSGYQGTVIGRGASGSEHWRFDMNGTQFRAIENGSNFGARGVLVGATTWIHVAWRYDGSESSNATRLRVWINGIEQTPSYTGTIPAALTSRSGNWWVGQMTDASNAFVFGLNGFVSQSIVCGAAVDPADIVRAYDYTNTRK